MCRGVWNCGALNASAPVIVSRANEAFDAIQLPNNFPNHQLWLPSLHPSARLAISKSPSFSELKVASPSISQSSRRGRCHDNESCSLQRSAMRCGIKASYRAQCRDPLYFCLLPKKSLDSEWTLSSSFLFPLHVSFLKVRVAVLPARADALSVWRFPLCKKSVARRKKWRDGRAGDGTKFSAFARPRMQTPLARQLFDLFLRSQLCSRSCRVIVGRNKHCCVIPCQAGRHFPRGSCGLLKSWRRRGRGGDTEICAASFHEKSVERILGIERTAEIDYKLLGKWN